MLFPEVRGMTETLYVVDGHSQIFRAYWAPMNDLSSPSGEPTKATFVFSQLLLNLLEQKKPDYLVMAMDGPEGPRRRLALAPDYKANRLDAKRSDLLEKHVRRCSNCKELISELRQQV